VQRLSVAAEDDLLLKVSEAPHADGCVAHAESKGPARRAEIHRECPRDGVGVAFQAPENVPAGARVVPPPRSSGHVQATSASGHR
jgi:hypothetical protein